MISKIIKPSFKKKRESLGFTREKGKIVFKPKDNKKQNAVLDRIISKRIETISENNKKKNLLKDKLSSLQLKKPKDKKESLSINLQIRKIKDEIKKIDLSQIKQLEYFDKKFKEKKDLLEFKEYKKYQIKEYKRSVDRSLKQEDALKSKLLKIKHPNIPLFILNQIPFYKEINGSALRDQCLKYLKKYNKNLSDLNKKDVIKIFSIEKKIRNY